jgi:hypothetical protein
MTRTISCVGVPNGKIFGMPCSWELSITGSRHQFPITDHELRSAMHRLVAAEPVLHSQWASVGHQLSAGSTTRTKGHSSAGT